MDIGIKRTQRDYTLAFKLAVVEQVERGELTYLQAQDRYGIQGSSTVLSWLRKYGHMDWYNLSSSDLKGTMMTKKPDLPLTPEQRIKALEVNSLTLNSRRSCLKLCSMSFKKNAESNSQKSLYAGPYRKRSCSNKHQ